MTERDRIEQAIAHMEAQRATLGDAVVEAALVPMREKLASLQARDAILPTATGERKLVTVMFADLSGFTALSEKLDPESVRDLTNSCFARLVPIVTQYEGTVDKFIGDEIMTLFGAPVAHENDPERAIRAALEMLETLAAFNAERHTDLGIHFGLNTGLVVVGGIGTGPRQNYSVMGDAVNLASRLEDASERGQIFVGPDTYRLTAPLFEFETLEPIKVKGKAEPVAVYRVMGPKAKPERVRGLERQGIQSELVGRDEELATLKGCIVKLSSAGPGGSATGGIVGVIGEAGLGKSRLMAEVRPPARPSPVAERHATGEGVLWLEGHTLSFGQTISYWPFQEILREWAGITEDDGEEAAWRKLESGVKSLFAEETVEVLPYLASLLALEAQGEYAERVKYLDGKAMGKQIFLTSRRFFERLAQARPTVLVFEDLHWADESSTKLLEHLLPLVERVPLLFIGLIRPDPNTPGARLREASAKNYANHYTELRLNPLSPDDSAQLLRNLLAIENLPSHLREMMVSKAEGNPFFLEEIIRTLIDAKAVVRDPASGPWQATAHIETLSLPDTIQGVIMARVDRLDEEVKQVLRTAAVIGRSFFYRVLKAVAEAEKSLDQHLAELQAIELIREKQITPELEYIFKHALAQEATYGSILLQKRRELHTRVGQALEMLFADHLEEFHGLLAYHYAKAEAWEKAQAYLLKAGDQAGRMAADAEALAHYQQALAAYARAFGDQWDPVQRAALERKMGQAFFRRGEHMKAVEYTERALNLLGRPFPRSPGAVRGAILKEVLQQVGYRLLPGLFLRQVPRITTPALEEEFLCYELIAWVEGVRNIERYLLVAIRSLNRAEQTGMTYWTSVGVAAIGVVLDIISIPRLAEFYHQWGMSLADQSQHPKAIGLAYTGHAAHGCGTGLLNQALEDALRGAEAYRKIGDLRFWGFVSWVATVYLTCLGRFSQSVAKSETMIQLGQEGADPEVWCWGLTELGEVQQRLGQLEPAIANLEKARELAEAIPDYVAHAQISAELGLGYLRAGDLRPGLAVLEAGQRVRLEHGVRGPTVARLVNGLAEAHLWLAEESPNGGGLKKAGEACRAAVKHNQTWRIALPDAMRLQGIYEWLRGKPKAARSWWERSLALAEAMGERYDAGLAHFEMAKRLGERAHLEMAEAIFAELGAEWDLAQARGLMTRHDS